MTALASTALRPATAFPGSVDQPGRGPVGVLVRGGTGGTSAHLADLEVAAAALDRAAEALERAVRHATALCAVIDEAAIWSPGTALPARTVAEPLRSPSRGIAVRAEQARTDARALRAVAEVYRSTDQDVAGSFAARLERAGLVAGGRLLGEAGPAAWLVGGVLVSAVALQHARTIGTLRLLRYSPSPVGRAVRILGTGDPRSPGVAGLLARLLGGPGLLPQLSPPGPATVERLMPGLSSFTTAALPGPAGPVTSDPVAHAAAVLATGGRSAALLFGRPMNGLIVSPAIGSRTAEGERPPRGTADVLEHVGSLYPTAGAGADPGSVGVQRLDHLDGSRSWVVAIPGTQEWAPMPGPNPMDLATNLAVLGGLRDDAGELAVQAMAAAGIALGEPVVLAGHSQGGMVAMDLATDPAIQRRFTIAAVVTAGSPVGSMGTTNGLPTGTQALHLEHAQDYVPALDGRPNPDDPRRTTVLADLDHVPWRADLRPVTSPVEAHDVGLYAETAHAMAGSADPSVAAFDRALAQVLGPQGTTATSEQYVGMRTELDAAGRPICLR